MKRLTSRITRIARTMLLRLIDYHPRIFWDLWAIDFDKNPEQIILHPWNIEALKLITRNTPNSILEIGCGFGRNLRVLLNDGFPSNRLYGIDISKRMLVKCRKHLDGSGVFLAQADITSLPFCDFCFDVVYVSLVLMHVAENNVIHGILEAIRVAKRSVVFLEEYRSMNSCEMTFNINDYTFAHNYKRYLQKLGYDIEQFFVMDKWCIFSIRKE